MFSNRLTSVLNKNPVMTIPIKKRINTEPFIDGRAELYIQNGKPNFLANLKKVNVGARPTLGGNENHYGILV